MCPWQNCSVYCFTLHSARAYKKLSGTYIYLQQLLFSWASRGVTEAAAVTIRTTTVTVATAVATYCCCCCCCCCCSVTRREDSHNQQYMTWVLGQVQESYILLWSWCTSREIEGTRSVVEPGSSLPFSCSGLCRRFPSGVVGVGVRWVC